MPQFADWLWLVAVIPLLVVLEQWIHRHLQGIWLLLVRDPDVASVLYAVVMLPGVALHEFSHWLMATLLLARTGRFSIIPERQPDGRLRLGFVETEKTDLLREALIGAAPVLFGSAIVTAMSYGLLGVGPVVEALAAGDLLAALAGLRAMAQAPDFWLWMYLIFTISNSMLPSASDRRTWLPVATLAVMALVALAYFGFSVIVWQALTGPVQAAIRALALAFTLTIGLNLFFVPLIWLIERGLMRVTGLRVEY